jgi:uncharacterized protein
LSSRRATSGPSDSALTLFIALAVVAAGLLIGVIGIGGVLVVPVLTEAGKTPVTTAIAASMCGFLFTGFVALAVQRREMTLLSRDAWALNVAALLGAAVGAWSIDWLPVSLVKLMVAAVAVASGIEALARVAPTHATRVVLSPPAFAGIGFVVGCGSAWSGTGGPVMLIPILLALGLPTAAALPLAQVIQIPIAASATGMNAVHGRIDWELALAVGTLLVIGALIGLRFARRIDPAGLRKAVAIGLIAVGAWYGIGALVQ